MLTLCIFNSTVPATEGYLNEQKGSDNAEAIQES
jgi:hypothetical protein